MYIPAYGLRTALCATILAAAGAPGLETPQVIDMPVGLTDLLEDPACTIGYRLDGQPEHILGWRWQGFDPDSGVYFVPERDADGKRQVFMHCPWRRGPGAAFAAFRLHLPGAVPIRLRIRTAIREAARKTDGVTFLVLVDGQALWRTHCTWRSWQEHEVDLSRFAGRTVELRLAVDPGPQRNTTEDWSLWGQALLLAGTQAQINAALARMERERALRRKKDFEQGAKRADRDLAVFSDSSPTTYQPTAAGRVHNDLRREGSRWVLRCRAQDETIDYLFRPDGGLLAGLDVRVDGRQMHPSPFIGGPRPILSGHEYVAASSSLRCRLVSAEAKGRRLLCRWEYTAEGSQGRALLEASLRASGKSLVLKVSAVEGTFGGFDVNTRGGEGPVPTAFIIGLPPRYFPAGSSGGLYAAAVPELWASNASRFSGASTRYMPLTDGSRRPLRDTFYLTVSSAYEEVLPNIGNRPSPYLDELAHRVVLDVWGGKFADDERWLKEMARYGLDAFLIIKHVWQRDGYDHSYPNVFPANAAQGGDAALRSLSLAAQKLGHRFCVHENFYDYYPNAEAFRPEDCALRPDGSTIPGWDNGQVQAVILKPSKLMDYARRFSPEIKRRYSCNAAYHDIMPTGHVDFDARVPESGMIRKTHEYTRQLCQFDRQLFNGPVVFESISSWMAGVYDGGCNHGIGTWRTPTAVAFELMKVHPKMSNHGFGYYERWLKWGYGPGWYDYVMTDRELDKYRATVVAFGRTGFIGHQLMKHPHAVVREYYLMQAFGRAYTGRKLRRLAYFIEDGDYRGWTDAPTAARYKRWQRIRAVYDGGQEVWVNLSDRPWKTPKRTLPPYSAMTFGPRAEAFTAIIDGQIADWAAYGNVQYADARSHVWQVLPPPPPIRPVLGDWKDNGDGTFNLTVNWQVGRKPERNMVVFWHFKVGPRIRFQYDHRPSSPTTKWQVGQTVADGPYRIRVPKDQTEAVYDLVVGLYDRKGRIPLVRGADQMRIARLNVQRAEGKVVKISIVPAEPEPPRGTDPEAYLQDANRDKRVIDFGRVATNGALVIRRADTAIELTPVPIGETMTVGLARRPTRVRAFDAEGRVIADLPARRVHGKWQFEIPAGTALIRAE